MLTELTFAIFKYGFLALLWLFVLLAMRSLYRDIETFSPLKSRAHRRKERHARKAVASPAPAATGRPAPTNEMSRTGAPSLLIIIDGPLAGTSIPLTGDVITLGRAASNTVVLDDEFVSSHHARVYRDPATNRWAIEDLGSTNGTVVNQRRLTEPTVLAPRAAVRIGATTFELR